MKKHAREFFFQREFSNFFLAWDWSEFPRVYFEAEKDFYKKSVFDENVD